MPERLIARLRTVILTGPQRWRLYQNYVRDVLMMRRGALEDEGIEFSNPSAPAQPAEPLAA